LYKRGLTRKNEQALFLRIKRSWIGVTAEKFRFRIKAGQLMNIFIFDVKKECEQRQSVSSCCFY